MMKILRLDFDGVIHSYKSPWKSPGIIPDDPVPGALEFIWQASLHFKVAIFSARSRCSDGRRAMRDFIAFHMEKYAQSIGTDATSLEDVLHCIDYPETKPPAFVGIDDRVLTFTGEFPAISQLLNFKPWNK